MSGVALDYGELLQEKKPQVIHGEEQSRAYIAELEHLTGKQEVTAAERLLIELLSLLIEDYESKHHGVPEATPVDVLRHLIEANGLRQKDLVDVFGTESIVSDVLNGKRELTKDHIRRLSGRFGISPAAFF